MAANFNPYSTWLGIPPDEQPPHYYRLLNVRLFENDLDKIEATGQRVISTIKLKEGGPSGQAARRLLAEVQFAMACLTDPKKKAKYDQELREWLESEGEEYEPEDEVERPAPRSAGAKKPRSSSSAGGSPAAAPAKAKKGQAAEKPAPAPKRTSKNQLSKSMIAFLIATTFGIIGLATAFAFVMFRNTDEPAVAKKDKDAEKAAKDAKKKVEKKPAEDENVSEEDEEGKSKDEKPEDDEEAEDPPTKKFEKPAVGATGEKTDEKPKDPAAEKTPEKDPGAAAENPKPDEKAPPEKPAVDPMPKEAPKEAPKEGEKPAEPKPEEKPAEPVKQDPHRELPADFLVLPTFATGTTPVVLGKLYPEGEERVNLKLFGGDSLLGKGGKFELTPGGAPPDQKWTVNLVDKANQKTAIAEFKYTNGELSFAWLGSGTAELNDAFRNARLQVAVGFKNKRYFLRKPFDLPPLTIKLEAKGQVVELPLDGLPDDTSNVVLEFTRLDGAFPQKPQYDPGPQITLGGQTDLLFIDNPLAFRLILKQERDGKINLDWTSKMNSVQGPKKGKAARKLAPYNVKGLDQTILGMEQFRMNKELQGAEFKKKLPAPKQQEFDLQMQNDLMKLDEELKKVKDFKKTIEELHDKGKIHFRVYIRVGEGVDGFVTEIAHTEVVAEAPADPAAKPADPAAPAK